MLGPNVTLAHFHLIAGKMSLISCKKAGTTIAKDLPQWLVECGQLRNWPASLSTHMGPAYRKDKDQENEYPIMLMRRLLRPPLPSVTKCGISFSAKFLVSAQQLLLSGATHEGGSWRVQLCGTTQHTDWVHTIRKRHHKPKYRQNEVA